MKIHYIQHVPFEYPANITVWAQERGHEVSGTLLFSDREFPSTDDFDWLVIMGGPMNVDEEDVYPWLASEKRFVRKVIEHKKTVLGICLGAQLIADVLGGTIMKNRHTEIGWHRVRLTQEGSATQVFNALPSDFIAFHWHEDTFSIPDGCIRTTESDGCLNQSFEYDGHVFGLQFHLESTDESIQQLIMHSGDDFPEGTYVQKPEKMLSRETYLYEIHEILTAFLDALEGQNR